MKLEFTTVPDRDAMSATIEISRDGEKKITLVGVADEDVGKYFRTHAQRFYEDLASRVRGKGV